jgi:histidine decarboxylase
LFASRLHIVENKISDYFTKSRTEGNICGLTSGRKLFTNGVIYYSRESHYSIPKAVRLLDAKGVVIHSKQNGEMDYSHLAEMVGKFHKYPVIINANIGTTMKGATDKFERIVSILNDLNIQDYYVHCDAALFTALSYFGADSANFNSLSLSRDRSFVSPFAHSIGHNSLANLRRIVDKCAVLTQKAVDVLKEINWPCWINLNSNVIVIERPCNLIVKKWRLASEGNESTFHITAEITEDTIRAFTSDLVDSLTHPLRWHQR